MKNISVILSILALLTAVVGLALALAAFFRRHGFCCDDDMEDYYYDEDDDDCCCDEGPIRIEDPQPQEEAEDASAGGEEDELSF